MLQNIEMNKVFGQDRAQRTKAKTEKWDYKSYTASAQQRCRENLKSGRKYRQTLHLIRD
jgi:hypothetical protein